MRVHLLDRTENFLGKYQQPIASDFEGTNYCISTHESLQLWENEAAGQKTVPCCQTYTEKA